MTAAKAHEATPRAGTKAREGARHNGGHPFASGGTSGPWKPTGPPPAKPSAQTRMEGEALDDLELGTPIFFRVSSCAFVA